MRVVLNVEIGLIQGLSDILIPFLIYKDITRELLCWW